MLIEDSFTVRTPVDRLWAVMQDVEQIAPCMPGAELTEVVDERTWKGKVHVKFGPVQMAFSGTVVMEERDDQARRARLSAKGTEQRGKGAATAKVESWLEPAAAQLSRGLLPEVSKLLTRQFAECLEAKVTDAGPTEPGSGETPTGPTEPGSGETPTEPEEATPAAPKAVGGFGLGLRALWATIARFFRRLLGRRDGS